MKASSLRWSYDLNNLDYDYHNYYSFIPSNNTEEDVYAAEVHLLLVFDH